MVMKLYIVRDELAEESGPIFEAKNDAVAERNFKNLLAQARGKIGDYRCFALGEIEHETDAVVIYPTPKLLALFMPGEEKKEE